MATQIGLIALVLVLAVGPGGEASASGPGYTQVEPRILPASADGRYTLSEAKANVETAPTTTDGRFKLVEIRQPAVGCSPFPDPLFANGFE